MIADLLDALPIHGFYLRRGTYAACGDGPIHLHLDLERAEDLDLVFDPAGLPDWLDDAQEAAEWLCADEFLAALRLEVGGPCPIRLVVRKLNGSLVDMNELASRKAGRYVAGKLIRLAADPSLLTALDDGAGLRMLRDALPITGVSAGTEVSAVVDLAPSDGYVIEPVIEPAGLPDWASGPESVAREVQEITAGIDITLRRRFRVVPPMRVVVRRLRSGPADGITDVRRELGRLLVEQAFRTAGIPLVLD